MKNFNPDYFGVIMFSLIAVANFHSGEYFIGAIWIMISAGYVYSGYLRDKSNKATEKLQKTYRDGIEYHYEILRKYQELKDSQR